MTKTYAWLSNHFLVLTVLQKGETQILVGIELNLQLPSPQPLLRGLSLHNSNLITSLLAPPTLSISISFTRIL